MSNFAFGTYRVTDLNQIHIEALKEAIDSGIRLIDTSTNYMDGGSQRAIAKALAYFDDDVRNEVKIVCKFGYIQGTTLQKHKQDAFEDVVEFSETCYHSISATFLKNQLDESLERLNVSNIDCYMIHNPEYFIYDALKKDMNRDDMLDKLYQRLYEAFVALEEEVKEGRINSYGISSNSFSKNSNDAEFLPYEDLITLAQEASKEVRNDTHSFSTIELAMNIVERDGLKCIKWAKENSLRVLVNRPLTAQKDNLVYRLAQYDEPVEYYHSLNELLEISDNDDLQKLYNLILQMDENKHKFGWIGEYDNFLYSQIIPHIKKAIEDIHEDVIETLLQYIDNFLIQYRFMVLYETSKLTKVALKEYFKDCETTMQICSLKFLQSIKEIDYILVGMRKPSYVSEVLSLVD